MALDLTQDTVEVAVVASGAAPIETDWITATWVETAPTSKITSQNRLTCEYRYIPVAATTADGSDSAYARFLLGPGGDIEFPDSGSAFDVWIRVTDDPEVPVVKAGTIKIAA